MKTSPAKPNESRNTFCRLCLQRNINLQNIFEENDETHNDISKYISLFFGVEITKNDPYSTSVCNNCCGILLTICRHRLKFLKNEELLRNPKSPNRSMRLKFKVTPRCHESVKKIFVKYKNIKLRQELWGINFNPVVVVKKLNIPLEFILNCVMKSRKTSIETNSQ